MPYVDENGSVMIDEVVANQDIAKLRSAREKLEEAKKYITQIITLNSEFTGPTAEAVSEATIEFQKQLDIQIQNIENATLFIQRTIQKYQAIDSSLKEQVNMQL